MPITPWAPYTAATPRRCSTRPAAARCTRACATQIYTTLELKVAYHKPITAETGLLRAIGRVVTLGKRVAFAEAMLTDATERLYASATSTLLIMEK